jgi:dolichol-phosphate mannosyltransferase
MPGVIAFLPTYNECGYIREIVTQVRALGPDHEALVVDDDSPDGTADIVREMQKADPGVHLIVRKGVTRGRGIAMIDAMRWAVARDYDAFIEMDADGSHDPSYIPAMTRELASADMVICSRLVPGGGETGRSFVRRWLTLAANMYIRLLLGIAVKDCTTGYRAYRAAALAALDLDRMFTTGPDIVQETLAAMTVRGFTVREIPFLFRQRKAGASKLGPLQLLNSIKSVWRIRKYYLNGAREK